MAALPARPGEVLSFSSALFAWAFEIRTRRPKMPSPALRAVRSSLCQTTTASAPLRTRILGTLWKPPSLMARAP